MKIRKTLTTLALACLLTATLAAPALAADPTIVSPATTAGSAVNAAVDNAYTVTTVSYTHLDVYKRQGQGCGKCQTDNPTDQMFLFHIYFLSDNG